VPSGIERVYILFPEELSAPGVRGRSWGDGTACAALRSAFEGGPRVGGGCAGLPARARGAPRCPAVNFCVSFGQTSRQPEAFESDPSSLGSNTHETTHNLLPSTARRACARGSSRVGTQSDQGR
jgi:hypothetical protein